ncbi:MAG: class I SAM-dependent RNA methyltransferase [Candidatus Aminicenantes bacterium]|nr:class I SAM-dependent RNA methyltransferase [Candidatus Aminicenantes bacterium]
MIGSVQTIAKGGCGIIHDAEKTVFVPGVISGETIEFDIQKKNKGIWQGKLLRVLEPSPQRLSAPCRHYLDCGGCNLQHMSYAEQLRCKEDILAANLIKIAAFKPRGPIPVLPSPPFRYRSKTELQVINSAIGFFKSKSHRLVAVRQCLLLNDAAEDFMRGLPPLPAADDGVLQVLSNGTDVAGRMQTRSGKIRKLTPCASLPFDFPPYHYQYGPEHFIQANLFQLQPMLELLIAQLPTNCDGAAADFFCGVGFFTLPLARHFKQVFALEKDPDNLAALRANLESNHITHVKIRCEDALEADIPPLDLVVLDPPRGGLSPALINRLAQVKKIIYFSCDSATFARDLRLFFSKNYNLRELQIIDNFPQTDHFEIFSVLEKATGAGS